MSHIRIPLLIGFALLAPIPAQVHADLVLYGTVRTMDDNRPTAEAVAIRGDTVAYVGHRKGVRPWIGPETRVLGAPEKGAILPGLIESHAHLAAVGRKLRELDLTGVRSQEELVQRVAQHAEDSEAEWIVGRGWNHELWERDEFPTAEALDAALPDRPAWLVRVDGHAALANSAALRAAGIDASTPDPRGGRIVRDEEGQPTGILIDSAMGLVTRHQPQRAERPQLIRDYLAAQRQAFRLGITTFVDAGTSFPALEILNGLYADGRMKLRTYNMIRVNQEDDLQALRATRPLKNLHDGRASARAIKLYADGALGSYGAWLSEPYADRPGERGLAVLDPEFIERVARFGLRHGYQVCVHAIGDRANHEVLDAFERALESVPEERRSDHRFRIEHAQILSPSDAERFRVLGVFPSMQGCHCTSDAPWVRERLGTRRAALMGYTWRTLLEAGAIIANGTDAPVEPLSPWRNFYSTVTRNFVRPDGTWDRFQPEQRMNRLEALKSMTAWGAAAIFEDRRLGRIETGLPADLIVVNRDPLSAPLWHVARAAVLLTLCDGEIVYER